ncbi:hypothetical protein KDW55_02220 [Burkholderia sp. AU19243]|uniref:hypothetical protein n=1 Tax=Burkholderia sp. AU19243 TaxID=2824810 RepID=UPI001B9918FB|nr:hypothetical protein [Burkholderia sp. AU19243]MBR8362133.1 hypothetical protein [Burkholderia sp. AU19243]
MTTDNSRADALTDEQRNAIGYAARMLEKFSDGRATAAIRTLSAMLTASPVSQPAAAPIGDNQIQVTHTIATEANAAIILHGLLDSFVEVAASFPSAVIDERLAGQVRVYLPAPSPADEQADERAAKMAHDLRCAGVAGTKAGDLLHAAAAMIEELAARAASANETGAEGAAIPYGHEFADMDGERHFKRGLLPSYAQSNIVPLYAAPQPAQADARVELTVDAAMACFRESLIEQKWNVTASEISAVLTHARVLLATPQPEPRAEVTDDDASLWRYVAQHAVIVDGSAEGMVVLTIAKDADSGALELATRNAVESLAARTGASS